MSSTPKQTHLHRTCPLCFTEMRGDRLVRHLHTHYDRIPDFMTAERRQETIRRKLPIVSNRVSPETTTQAFALCLVCKKGATHWTHGKPQSFLKAHLQQSPLCFDADEFETVKHIVMGLRGVTHVPAPVISTSVAPAPVITESDDVLKPSVKVALDAAVAYDADDEVEEEDKPKTLNDKVDALVKSYRFSQRMSMKRYEENRRLKDEVELTREMMRLYRRAAVRLRRGERLMGCKRSIAIARQDLARLRAGAEASSDTGDLSSASDRSE